MGFDGVTIPPGEVFDYFNAGDGGGAEHEDVASIFAMLVVDSEPDLFPVVIVRMDESGETLASLREDTHLHFAAAVQR